MYEAKISDGRKFTFMEASKLQEVCNKSKDPILMIPVTNLCVTIHPNSSALINKSVNPPIFIPYTGSSAHFNPKLDAGAMPPIKSTFGCSRCSAVFAGKGGLTRHNNEIHLKVNKPLSCPLCPKRFRHKPALKDHLVSHSDARPFTCPCCPKSYKRKFSMSKHLAEIHLGIRNTVPCSICGKDFAERKCRNVHIKAKHCIPYINKNGVGFKWEDVSVEDKKMMFNWYMATFVQDISHVKLD